MEKYKSLHKWMIIPLVLMLIGIAPDYFGDFTENAWSVHVHFWTGMIWYLYLIIQPYYCDEDSYEEDCTYEGLNEVFIYNKGRS